MNAVPLVVTLQRYGLILISLPEGKLAVQLAARLTAERRRRSHQSNTAGVAFLTSPSINDRGELILPVASDRKYH